MSVNLVKQWFPQFLTALDRAPMAGLLCAAALLFGVTLAWTRSAAGRPRASGMGFRATPACATLASRTGSRAGPRAREPGESGAAEPPRETPRKRGRARPLGSGGELRYDC